MAKATEKVTNLPDIGVPAGTDILYISDETNNLDKKVTVTNLQISNSFAALTDTTITSAADAEIPIFDSAVGGGDWINKGITGDISITKAGVVAIASGVILNADVNASAAIVTSKLADSANFVLKNTAQTYDDGIKLTFNPNGTNAGINFGSQAGDPSTLANGDVWYNSSTNKFRARESGANTDMIGGGAAAVTAWKDSVRIASTANLTLSGEQTIDGITTSTDRILVKDQTTASENGIYVTAAGAWTRATDFDTDADAIPMSRTMSQEGTINAKVMWTMTTLNPITLGTTSLTFTEDQRFTEGSIQTTSQALELHGDVNPKVRVNGSIVESWSQTRIEWGTDVAAFGKNVEDAGVIFMGEQASANTDRTNEGQIWVQTGAPNKLFFTDDAGTDFDLTTGGEVFTWTADHSAGSFDLTTLGNLLMTADETHLIDITRDTAQADDYTIGEIRFRHDDGLSVLQNYARIEGVMESDVDTTEDGSLHFYVTELGNHDVEFISLNNASDNTIVFFKEIDLVNSTSISMNAGILKFQGSQFEIAGGSTLIIESNSGQDLNFNINSATKFRVGLNNINIFQPTNMNTNDLTGVGILNFGNANTTITRVTEDLEYDVATGDSHRFRVNNVTEMELDTTNGLVLQRRIQGNKGSDVASGTTITLGNDGNLFDITGTTQIDAMASTNWQAGSVVILHFDGILNVRHNIGADGFFLQGAGTFATTADDTLTLVWNGTRWEETARSVN